MRLILDTVQGSEANVAVYEGRLIRTAIVKDPPLGVGAISNPAAVIAALSAFGMPQRGDPFPDAAFQDYFLKRHVVRALTATTLAVQLIYEWHGLLTIVDTSTLTNVQTQLHPNGFVPIYVSWQNPNDVAGGTVKRVATFNTTLPLRHVIASQTVDHPASSGVLNSFASVNKYPWNGLPAGFWLFSGLEGESDDNGITYRYTCTLTTKQREDWSQIEYLKDERGVAVIVKSTDVTALRVKPYAFSIDTSVNGVTKVGLYPLVDFSTLFGFGN